MNAVNVWAIVCSGISAIKVKLYVGRPKDWDLDSEKLVLQTLRKDLIVCGRLSDGPTSLLE